MDFLYFVLFFPFLAGEGQQMEFNRKLQLKFLCSNDWRISININHDVSSEDPALSSFGGSCAPSSRTSLQRDKNKYIKNWQIHILKLKNKVDIDAYFIIRMAKHFIEQILSSSYIWPILVIYFFKIDENW